jgi:hypothetical protein
MTYRWISILCLLLALAASNSAIADSTNYDRHVGRGVGIEVNILWPLPPFKTYEVKLLVPVSDGADLVIGWGHQAWTIPESDKVNPGTMDSHALILGVKQFLFRTSAVGEYDAWLAHDHFTNRDGKVYDGYSLSNEFFGGYEFYLGGTRATVTTGMNAGFWSYKSYTQAIDDRFTWTVVPKVNAGFESKK